MADDTRQRLIDATVRTLADEGIAGTSARAIGKHAGVHPALIYYHFDNLTALLAEVSREVTARRAAAYRQRLASVDSLTQLAAAARQLHEEERASGTLAMLAQLLAGARTHPQLADALHDNFEQLAGVVATTIQRILADSPLDGLLDSAQLARAISAGFIGIELLDTVTGDDDPALFDTLDSLTALVDVVLTAGTLPTSVLRRRLRNARTTR